MSPQCYYKGKKNYQTEKIHAQRFARPSKLTIFNKIRNKYF